MISNRTTSSVKAGANPRMVNELPGTLGQEKGSRCCLEGLRLPRQGYPRRHAQQVQDVLIVFIVQTLAQRTEGPDWHNLVGPGSRPRTQTSRRRHLTWGLTVDRG